MTAMKGGEPRLNAIARGEKTYIGEPCARGHTKRYTRDNKCALCLKARMRRVRNSFIDPPPPMAPLPRREVPLPVTGSDFIPPLPLERLMARR
jgi:hypothetical protein